MSCSYFTCVLAIVIVWACMAVNSTAMISLSAGHEAHNSPEAIYFQHEKDKRTAQQVCGSRLIGTLRALCQGSYAGLTRRSDPGMRATTDESDYREPNNNEILDSSLYPIGNHEEGTPSDFELMWPYNPKLLAMKLITEGGAHQRFRRNIIEECCHKPCTRVAMQKYCGRQ